MNKIINELFNRAGGWTEVCDVSGEEILTYNEHLDPEKFAELIVQECIEQASIGNGHGNNQWDRALTFAAKNIKEHFGVEE